MGEVPLYQNLRPDNNKAFRVNPETPDSTPELSSATLRITSPSFRPARAVEFNYMVTSLIRNSKPP